MSAAAAAMSSVQAFREFIDQRLTAAALEIFAAFERTIVQYEEQMDRQRRLMDGRRGRTGDGGWTPAVRVHGAGAGQRVSQQGPLQDRGPPTPQGQEEAEPPRTKEEEAEPVSVTVGLEVLGGGEEVKQEADAVVVTLTDEGERAAAAGHADVQSHVELRLSDRCRHDDVSQNRQETDTYCDASPRRRPPALHHRRVNEEPACCQTCGERFGSERDLLRHARTHAGPKPHGCETCGKVFSHRAVLFRHRKTHTGEKPHACETCGKRFGEHAILLRHRRTHTGEKPYACQTCGKRFSQHGNMLVHTRTHTGQRPYRCQTCGKSFSQQGTLLRHGRTHAAPRPRHVCAVCAKSYSERAALAKHLLAHAGQPTRL